MLLQQSEATAAQRRILVYLVDDTDGKTPKTSITVSAGDIKIGKNGAAEANHGGTWTEIASGFYYYEFSSGECDTLGFLSFRIIKTGVRTFGKSCQVVPWDPYDATRLGMTALPNAAAASSGGLPTSGTGSNQIDLSSGNGRVRLSATGVDDIWDEAMSGHTTAGTFGLSASPLRTATATGGTSTTITLDASASTTAEFFTNQRIVIKSGTGAGQARPITAYSTGRVATVSPAWATTPDGTSVFEILPDGLDVVSKDALVDAIWDEARSGHATAGTFGEGVASVQGAVTGAVGSVTGAVGSVASGGITAASIASDAITAAKIATGAITAAKFAAGAIDATALAANCITSSQVASGALTAAKFADAFLTSAKVDPSAALYLADSLLDRTDAIDSGLTPRKAMRGWAAVLLGKVSGLPTSPVFRNVADTKNVVSASCDSTGNRTSITTDLT